ncbi:MAG: NAD-dependent epimerase/dehydratase family protein [Clostridia bacterium]|nr:NAD-dependent epimerase/dehydratase family protein [Deltaproteobacteria bacterium]
MRALVTGANGLLGSNLVRELITRGHEARAMVRRTSNVEGLAGLDTSMVYGDVRNIDELTRAAEGCDVIFHTAAVFSYWGYTREVMMETAKGGVTNALDAAKAAGSKRVVLTSSTAVFGGSDGPKVLDEHAALVEVGVPDYFASKAIQERVALEHAAKVGVELVVANPSLFVGSYDYRPSASLATITGYLGDPLKITYPGGVNIIHAGDVAIGHILLAERGEPNEHYVIAAENVTWREVHDTISELCGVPKPRIKVTRTPALAAASLMELAAKITRKAPLATRALAEQTGRYFWYSNAKIARLGFLPRSMRQTLTQTIAWLLVSPHLTNKQRAKLRPHDDVLQAMRQAQVAQRLKSVRIQDLS